ncbi:hypothetical protein SAMN04515695_2301 [Pseudovibrio sp. Tun.PSC04-5.I4]|nr:hypothetical protein SAMN04515695_2301 [Pseudovibrio sp. Tun.PSC04-5.I4]
MSVYRPKDKSGHYKNPEWHYDFQWKGRRFCGNTGATTKRQAKKVEKQLREDVKAPRDTTSIDGAFDLFWEEVGNHYSDSATFSWRMQFLQDNCQCWMYSPQKRWLKIPHFFSFDFCLKGHAPSNKSWPNSPLRSCWKEGVWRSGQSREDRNDP